MNDSKELRSNLEKVHTTKMGVDRITTNLDLQVDDVVEWCKSKIATSGCSISRKGKNFYAAIDDCVITINAHSYTIITAHKTKGDL